MTVIASILVIFSAFLHAGWNLIGKSNQGSGFAFFFTCSVAPAILLTPYLYWFFSQIELVSLSSYFWLLLSVSGFFQVIYLYGLSLAYQTSDIGVVYPMARALPVLMVGVGTAVLGQSVSFEQWMGFGLITVGCLLTPITHLTQLRMKAYFNRSLLWAFVAAIGTTGYSIIDKTALHELNDNVGEIHSAVYIAIFYLGIQFWAIVLWLSVWFFVSGRRHEFSHAWRFKKKGTIAGVMMASTYGLVLFAMTMVDNVSYVVALRQVSIAFGLVMGIIFLHEKWYPIRGAGVAAVLLGLLISLD
ncbi:EamA family transporter [Aliivibrio salmonicida]|uniref:EamA family transporter n=1 Tax=Aliivibrio salmonicida TaxID=40269 RepID=UPI003D114759